MGKVVGEAVQREVQTLKDHPLFKCIKPQDGQPLHKFSIGSFLGELKEHAPSILRMMDSVASAFDRPDEGLAPREISKERMRVTSARRLLDAQVTVS